MRLHVLGIPHTITAPEYSACAFTQKVYKFVEMMSPRGHELIHYGHQESKVNCENVMLTDNATLQSTYGSYDWKKNFFKYDIADHAHKVFTTNAIKELTRRYLPGDIVLPFWGFGHKAIIDALPKMITIEPGVGYPSGPFCRWKVFESYAMLHAYMGLSAVSRANPNWYNMVIPNYFNPTDFTYSEDKDDYFLYLGRVCNAKGVNIAIDVCERIAKKLVIAGQTDGSITFPKHVEYVGYADRETRRTLMSRAKATFCPSLYLEPFCGVAVESLFSGTPIITTDWGAFTEYNEHGRTGFRCRALRDFIAAAHSVDDINPSSCAKVANERFSYNAVAPMYERVFQDVLNLYQGNGIINADYKEGSSCAYQ